MRPDSGGGQSGSIGLGFAIPVDQAKRIADELISTGTATHASLGVQLSNDSSAQGAAIAQVVDGGPAAAAGLPNGVVVTKVDDQVIDSSEALVAAVRSKAPGDTVTLTYQDPSGASQRLTSPSAPHDGGRVGHSLCDQAAEQPRSVAAGTISQAPVARGGRAVRSARCRCPPFA